MVTQATTCQPSCHWSRWKEWACPPPPCTAWRPHFIFNKVKHPVRSNSPDICDSCFRWHQKWLINWLTEGLVSYGGTWYLDILRWRSCPPGKNIMHCDPDFHIRFSIWILFWGTVVTKNTLMESRLQLNYLDKWTVSTYSCSVEISWGARIPKFFTS